jgi:hypothetical protein
MDGSDAAGVEVIGPDMEEFMRDGGDVRASLSEDNGGSPPADSTLPSDDALGCIDIPAPLCGSKPDPVPSLEVWRFALACSVSLSESEMAASNGPSVAIVPLEAGVESREDGTHMPTDQGICEVCSSSFSEAIEDAPSKFFTIGYTRVLTLHDAAISTVCVISETATA